MQKQNTIKQSILVAVRGLYVLTTVAVFIMSLSMIGGQ